MKKQKPKKLRSKAEIARHYFMNFETHRPWVTVEDTILAALRAYDRELKKAKRAEGRK